MYLNRTCSRSLREAGELLTRPTVGDNLVPPVYGKLVLHDTSQSPGRGAGVLPSKVQSIHRDRNTPGELMNPGVPVLSYYFQLVFLLTKLLPKVP